MARDLQGHPRPTGPGQEFYTAEPPTVRYPTLRPRAGPDSVPTRTKLRRPARGKPAGGKRPTPHGGVSGQSGVAPTVVDATSDYNKHHLSRTTPKPHPAKPPAQPGRSTIGIASTGHPTTDPGQRRRAKTEPLRVSGGLMCTPVAWFRGAEQCDPAANHSRRSRSPSPTAPTRTPPPVRPTPVPRSSINPTADRTGHQPDTGQTA
jgi:hypothetical protein